MEGEGKTFLHIRKWEVSSPGSVSLPASSKESKTPQIKEGLLSIQGKNI